MKQPAPVYQRIAGHQWRHIWLSGDIHGCLEQLRRKLWHCGFDPWRDLLISVGDVIDRGPQSLRCLQLLEQHWVRAVRGNHEQMAMDALASQQMSLWLMNGGDWFIALADNQQKQAKTALEKCQHLPFILEVHSRTGKHVIAHADYPDDVYEWQKDVDLHQVLWSRSRLREGQKGQGITGADHFWFGHTPLRHRVDIGNLHYIDAGAVFGGELTLVQLQ
ncbi:protein-serine/threonine phosphatase [Escherichia coli]|uniref:protein-serine/threonine phosphatase n=1 Tax=Escherichia coli TaxID=562 RepID=UPI0021F41D93|nr:protein-serine/threonine phosphatase [Escherichia coli]EIQ6340478.1 protein-serine/threonine phosphatase [Escherichia coli]MCV8794663.1 protein-serine/threonine phosphatase [Escherichia coli]MDZ3860976.1 protein-serine/threonine phosphatase [Escherichia coli]